MIICNFGQCYSFGKRTPPGEAAQCANQIRTILRGWQDILGKLFEHLLECSHERVDLVIFFKYGEQDT
jgi:hypothetical protein